MELRGWNIITWTPDNASGDERYRCPLTVEGDWVMAVGTKPNVNRAIVPAGELAKASGRVGQVGVIEFWFTRPPPAPGAVPEGQPAPLPDHSIAGVRIVEIEPNTVGLLAGGDQVEVVDYRVFFADVREQFVDPHGGLVSLDPIPEGTSVGELVALCLKALGLPETHPETLDDMLPPKGLRGWKGAHAATELGKLARHAHMVLAVGSDGKLSIQEPFEGTAPVVAAQRKIADVEIPFTAATMLIIDSAPNAAIKKEAWLGPSPETFEIAWQDSPDGPWKTPADRITGDMFSPSKEALEGLRNAELALAAREVRGDRVLESLHGDSPEVQMRVEMIRRGFCRAIKLGTKFKDRSSLRIAPEGLGGTAVSFEAIQPIRQDGRGLWIQSPQMVPLTVTAFQQGRQVVQFAERFGRLSRSHANNPDALFALPVYGDLMGYFYTEELRPDGTPWFFEAGFLLVKSPGQPDQVVQMTSSDVDAAMGRTLKGTTEGMVLLHRPELRANIENGEWTNLADLNNRARRIAEAFFKRGPSRRIQAVGFLKAELSGRVSEIRWSQRDLKTSVRIDDWYSPLNPLGRSMGGGT